jgi:hypothetical protein
MKIPREIFKLSEKNRQIVTSLCLEMGCKDEELSKDWDLSRKAGEIFMKRVFQKYQYDMFLTHSIFKDKENILASAKKKEIAKHLLYRDHTLVVIRPELYHSTQKIINFLKERGFCVVTVFNKEINPETYWQMYKTAIVHKDAADTIPSRTMIYTNSPAKVILLRSSKYYPQLEELLADSFFSFYKGNQGVRDLNTLRGGLVFSEAVKLGFNTLENPIIKMACDPLGAYRHKIKGNSKAKTIPHGHLLEEYQMLQYTGVGIHVPDSGEFLDDVCSLLSLRQLKTLQNLTLPDLVG